MSSSRSHSYQMTVSAGDSSSSPDVILGSSSSSFQAYGGCENWRKNLLCRCNRCRGCRKNSCARSLADRFGSWRPADACYVCWIILGFDCGGFGNCLPGSCMLALLRWSARVASMSWDHSSLSLEDQTASSCRPISFHSPHFQTLVSRRHWSSQFCLLRQAGWTL